MNTHSNAFGNDATFAQLAEKIRGFSFDDSSPTEQMDLIGALKLLAEDTVTRWENVRKMEVELKGKLQTADICEAMSEVLVITREGKIIENQPPVPAVAKRVPLAGRIWSR